MRRWWWRRRRRRRRKKEEEKEEEEEEWSDDNTQQRLVHIILYILQSFLLPQVFRVKVFVILDKFAFVDMLPAVFWLSYANVGLSVRLRSQCQGDQVRIQGHSDSNNAGDNLY